MNCLRPDQRSKSKPTHARAFTILEMVVTLTILAAIAAIALPLLSQTTEDSRRQVTLATLGRLQDLIANRYALDMKGVIGDPLSSNAFEQAVYRGFPGPDPNTTTTPLIPPTRQLHLQLHFLFVDPSTNTTTNSYHPVSRRGWNGPYLLSGQSGTFPTLDAGWAALNFSNNYGESGDSTVLDGWSHPIVLLTPDDYQSGDPYTITTIILVSAGADGTLKTSDDLRVSLQ